MEFAESPRPTVAAVIVMYNSADEAIPCVRSCLAQHGVDMSVILVNNGSTDQSGQVAETAFLDEPRLEILEVSPNRGFSGGANAGLSRALRCDSDFIWLLTDDLEIDPRAAIELAEAMDAHPLAGAAGQMIYDASQRDRIYYCGGTVDLSGSNHELEGLIDDGSLGSAAPRETGFVTGASMFFRPDALLGAGLMDESFWLYWEDVDLSLRIADAGFQLLVVPRSHAWHHTTPPRDRSMPKRLRYYWRNYFRIVEKHELGSRSSAIRTALGLLRDEYHREGIGASIAILRGLLDYTLKRSGPISNSW